MSILFPLFNLNVPWYASNMSEVLVFRQLTPSDCALLESELPTPNDVDYCAKIERQTPGGYGFYGLFTGAKLIGVCQVRRHGPNDPRALKLATCPEIGNLYIVPAKRNQGYAKVILQRI